MTEVKISVCIPVYGVEEYIGRCSRSLFEQTLQDGIEFIFVNDCTKDKSIEILTQVLDEYPNRKKQVQIIHANRNGGSAETRNIAMSHAKGKYIIYCDSDDWVEPDMYEILLEMALSTDADMVICGFTWEYPDKSIPTTIQLLNSPVDYVVDMLSSKIHCSTWNKLIRRELYSETGIFFPRGINMWEDVNVIIPLTYHCRKISVVNRSLYHYEQSNALSYTHELSPKSLYNLEQTISKLETFAEYTSKPKIIQAVNFFKLTARLNFLLRSKDNNLIRYANIYPEANRYIWRYRAMSIYWRIGLWVASKGGMNILRLMKKIRRAIKN